MIRPWILAIALILIFLRHSCAVDPGAALEEARAGNRGSLAMISSLYARVQIGGRDKNGQVSLTDKSSEYWRTPEAEKLVENYAPTSSSIAVTKGGMVKSIVKGKNARGQDIISNGFIGLPGQLNWHYNAWRRALCVLPIIGLTLDEVLGGPHKLLAVSEVREGGKPMTKVVIDYENYHYEILLDRAVNYMARQVNTTYVHHDYAGKAIKMRHEAIVETFDEVEPGIFFPSFVAQKDFQDGKMMFEGVSRISDIRVNLSIPASVFDLRFPAGIEVYDKRREVIYKIGPSEEPVGPVNPAPVGVSSQGAVAGDGPTPLDADERGFPWRRVALSCSVAMMAVGVILWVRRRYQSTAEAP